MENGKWKLEIGNWKLENALSYIYIKPLLFEKMK